MVGTCPTNGGLQNTSPGHTVGVESIQEEARTTKDKLDGHRETQPENGATENAGPENAGQNVFDF